MVIQHDDSLLIGKQESYLALACFFGMADRGCTEAQEQETQNHYAFHEGFPYAVCSDAQRLLI